MIRACRRCPTPTMPLISPASAKGPDGIEIRVEVALCQPCRIKAGQENAAALGRRTGKEVPPS